MESPKKLSRKPKRKEPKMKLEFIGDMEPNCPKCKSCNAMLSQWDKTTEERVYKCRDCGFSIAVNEVTLVQKGN